ncbi:MAG: rhodanese-like domain-containing protein [Pseudomonadota bacterium]
MNKILSVDAKELRDMESEQRVQLIDVREPAEYSNGHIEHSTNIPLSCLLSEIDQFDSNKKMVMICRAGVRSRLACEKLIAEGYNFDLFNLEGGVIAWENAGYKIKK